MKKPKKKKAHRSTRRPKSRKTFFFSIPTSGAYMISTEKMTFGKDGIRPMDFVWWNSKTQVCVKAKNKGAASSFLASLVDDRNAVFYCGMEPSAKEITGTYYV